MSEEAAPAKKKGKFPIVIVLGLMLMAGGFFGMKMRGGPAKKPEVKLSADKAADLKEFLVNLRDRGVYCRAEISLGLAEGVDPKTIDTHVAAVRDAINLRINSKSLADLSSIKGLDLLKREIAYDVNKVLLSFDPKKDTSDKKDAKDSKDSKDASDGPADPDKPGKIIHPEWDSDTGPVLVVYFDSFATQ